MKHPHFFKVNASIRAFYSVSSLLQQNLAFDYLHFFPSTYKNTQEFTFLKNRFDPATLLQGTILFFSFPSLSNLLKAQFALTVGASFPPTPT